jgi:hypothetical protein
MTVKLAYMDAVDFHHELGAAPEITLYSSLEEVIKTNICARHCGVVSVAVSLYKQELEGKSCVEFTAADMISKSAKYKEYMRTSIEHWRSQASRLQTRAQDLLRQAVTMELELALSDPVEVTP